MTKLTTDKAINAYFPAGVNKYADLPTLKSAFDATVNQGLDLSDAKRLAQLVQQKATFTILMNHNTRKGGVSGVSYDFRQDIESKLGLDFSSTIEDSDIEQIRQDIEKAINEHPDAYGVEVQPILTQADETQVNNQNFGPDIEPITA